MSSRSFRRRNNRRRHRGGQGDLPPEQGGGSSSQGPESPQGRGPGPGADRPIDQGAGGGRSPEPRPAGRGGGDRPAGQPGAGRRRGRRHGGGERRGTGRGEGGDGGERRGSGRREGGGRQQGRADRPADRGRDEKSGRADGRGGRPAPRPASSFPAEAFPTRPPVELVIPDCPLCAKPVRELSSALTHRVSGQPAHFDCIMKELRDSNEVGPEERLCYLGAGAFGILEFTTSGGASRFVIKKRIQYEEKESPQDWKKPLQIIT